jgi:hypothetical protein
MSESQPKTFNPTAFAVVASLVVVLVVLSFGAGIAVNYFLMVHYVHNLQASQQAQGVKTCQLLIGLDNAKNGIHFSAPTKTGTAELYILRFTESLHRLVVGTKCYQLVKH